MNTSKITLTVMVGAALICFATVSGSTFAQASCQEHCADACRGKGGLCFNNCSTRCAQQGNAKRN